MKIDVTKEWCLKMAKMENGYSIGAGLAARDPVYVECPMPDDVCADCGYRCFDLPLPGEAE